MWHAWERREKCTRFWWESPRESDHLEDQGVDGKMGSEWILGRLASGCGLDSTGSGQGPVAGCCECGDEPSGSCATYNAIYKIGYITRKSGHDRFLPHHFQFIIHLPTFNSTLHSVLLKKVSLNKLQIQIY
jgi:hypothetical protein